MRVIFTLILYVVPTGTLLAQSVTVTTILNMLIGQIDTLVLLAVSIALVVFIWGIVRMMIAMNTGESDKAITEGKQKMVWGVVALFVIVSIWGIIEILINMFGVGNPTIGTPPIII